MSSGPFLKDGSPHLRVEGAVSYRVVELGLPQRGHAIIPSEPVVLSDGLSLVMSTATGDCIIERSVAAADGVLVEVDDEPIYEVAHVRPFQLIRVNQRCFVVIPPYGVYLNGVAAAAAMAPTAPTPLRKMVTAQEPPVTVSSVVASTPEQKPKRRASLRLKILLIVMMFAGAGAWLAHSTPTIDASGTVRVRRSDGAPPVVAAAVPPPSGPALVPQIVPTQSVVASPRQGAAAASLPSEFAAHSPAVVSGPKVPATTRSRAQNATKRAAAPTAAVVPETTESPDVAPERARSVRAQIQSYQLEAGFDPEGASRKLRALKQSIPATSKLQAEIERALHSL